jgi:methyl-accepting chemotaxis protein-2 (aspartate sensor receptor)
MSLNNVRIGTKLFLAFGFIILLMIVSSGLSLLSLSRANSGMQTIISEDYPTTVKANQLIEQFQEFVSTQQLMLLDDQGTYTATSQQHLKEISENITRIATDLTNTLSDEKSQKILSEFTQIRQQYLESRFRILKAIQDNDRPGAVAEMMTTTLQLQQAYKTKVQELIAVQNHEMQMGGAAVESDFKSNRLILILLALGSVVAASVIGWFIARSITHPLGQAVSLAGFHGH